MPKTSAQERVRQRGRYVLWAGVAFALGWTFLLAGLFLCSGPGALILVGIVIAPTVIAIRGRDRPGALLAAAGASVPGSMLSVDGVALPLLIPAALYCAAAWRATGP